jgi:hypothetical protein
LLKTCPSQRKTWSKRRQSSFIRDSNHWSDEAEDTDLLLHLSAQHTSCNEGKLSLLKILNKHVTDCLFANRRLYPLDLPMNRNLPPSNLSICLRTQCDDGDGPLFLFTLGLGVPAEKVGINMSIFISSGPYQPEEGQKGQEKCPCFTNDGTIVQYAATKYLRLSEDQLYPH